MLSAVRPARVPGHREDGCQRPGAAPAAAVPTPTARPESGPRPALMYVGWAPALRGEGTCRVSMPKAAFSLPAAPEEIPPPQVCKYGRFSLG